MQGITSLNGGTEIAAAKQQIDDVNKQEAELKKMATSIFAERNNPKADHSPETEVERQQELMQIQAAIQILNTTIRTLVKLLLNLSSEEEQNNPELEVAGSVTPEQIDSFDKEFKSKDKKKAA